jgi:hypothetical protein
LSVEVVAERMVQGLGRLAVLQNRGLVPARPPPGGCWTCSWEAIPSRLVLKAVSVAACSHHTKNQTPIRNHGIDSESMRLAEDARREQNWKRWGPYLAVRQWGTVREDYSAGGTYWD